MARSLTSARQGITFWTTKRQMMIPHREANRPVKSQSAHRMQSHRPNRGDGVWGAAYRRSLRCCRVSGYEFWTYSRDGAAQIDESGSGCGRCRAQPQTAGCFHAHKRDGTARKSRSKKRQRSPNNGAPRPNKQRPLRPRTGNHLR